jgi:hypothetical protein
MQESQVFRIFKPRNSIHESFYEIQWLTGFQSFPQTLTAHHASPPMGGPNPFGTPPFYHRARRGSG